MNRGAALKVSAQHKCIMVQQGSQAVLTASHCLQGTQRSSGEKPHFFQWLAAGGWPSSKNYFQESILSTIILVLGVSSYFPHRQNGQSQS